VIQPFTVLRRLDCVLEPSKEAVLVEQELRESHGLDPEPFLLRVAGGGEIANEILVFTANSEHLVTNVLIAVLLQERRSALISAAVTGQIDVRGLVPEASAT